MVNMLSRRFRNSFVVGFANAYFFVLSMFLVLHSLRLLHSTILCSIVVFFCIFFNVVLLLVVFSVILVCFCLFVHHGLPLPRFAPGERRGFRTCPCPFLSRSQVRRVVVARFFQRVVREKLSNSGPWLVWLMAPWGNFEF